MTKRIFRTIFVVAIGVFLASFLLFMTILYDYYSGVQQDQLQIQTELAAQGVEHEGAAYLEGLSVKDCRITWIGAEGSVLYDSISKAGEMENHLEREEVKEALTDGHGSSSRYSSTLTERYFYCAKRLTDGTVIRLSAVQNTLLVLTIGMLQPICIIFVAAVAVSMILAARLAKKLVKPFNEINLERPMENEGYDELSPLLGRIDLQQKEIRRQKQELIQKKNELDVLISSMKEGLILMSQSGTILSINQAAADLFGIDTLNVGRNLLTVSQNEELEMLIDKAKKGEYAETVMDLGKGRYQVGASPVILRDTLSGIVLLLLDITEKEKAEQLRREFTANVSHELKTPLHTILGSAELMMGGLVRQEDTAAFARRIYTESQRMIQLVEDIIKLSHLDEGAEDMKWEMVDLAALAKQTISSLEEEAKKRKVTLSLEAAPAAVYGIRQLLQEILYNLCDNAIKYNHPGGFAVIQLRKEKDFTVLSVSDSGIGIPPEHQERVFERFYRVDKSHSKEIGGTGLGLSIVKHAARLHGAEIDLCSRPGKGTTIRVRFLKKEGEPMKQNIVKKD
ncbi:MAG: PAS domain S-box protein [Lachnospiraceae bacterium]|jgi:two-component system phosphate regulon sensor histidine kinase PhoR|nr:PAS domain S-box protein [Lachnospiraceae bacterium]